MQHPTNGPWPRETTGGVKGQSDDNFEPQAKKISSLLLLISSNDVPVG